ncbi:uncharacterized protein LOC131292988 [Anopheles ziemanni]|uniref:uncharacterized protein LOC131292988 n=1 Tax=Anopheles ziemanni TaxID=345580 RepID=UPI00265F6355|nr:uncharacterized protein LOC131292988 [Anopheles ziemanni]
MRSGFVTSWMLAAVVLATLLAVIPASAQRGDFKKAVPHQKLERLQANPASVNQVSDSVTNLAQKIARAIASPKSKTEIFSPVSIAGALSLLLLGASGRTQQELMRVMGFNDGQLSFQEIHFAFGRLFQDLVANDPTLVPLVTWRVNDKCNRYDEEDDYEDEFPPANTTANTSPSHRISVVNGMFLQKGLKPADRLVSVMRQFYQSTVNNLDFERDPGGAAAYINEWCSRETNGKIQDMVSAQMLSNSRMIVASAVYFKAQWETTFSPYGTRPRPFYLNGRQQPPIDVEMMATTGCFPYFDATAQFDVQIIGLPYETGISTMYIVVPNGSTREILQQKQSILGADQLNWMIDQMRTKKGMIVLPKLSITNRIELSNVLQQLGVRDLFDPVRSNLSRVLDDTASQTDSQQAIPSRQPPPQQQEQPTRPNVQAVASRFEPPASTATSGNRPTSAPVIRPTTSQPSLQQFNKQQQLQQQQQQQLQQQLQQQQLQQQLQQQQNNYDAAGCGTQVASYESSDVGKRCVFGIGNNIIGTTYICIKKNYKPETQFQSQAHCEQYGCIYFSNQCYCCQQYPQGNVPIAQTVPQSAVASRFDVEANRPAQPQAPVVGYNGLQQSCEVVKSLNSLQACELYRFRWLAYQGVCVNDATCRPVRRSKRQLQRQQEPYPAIQFPQEPQQRQQQQQQTQQPWQQGELQNRQQQPQVQTQQLQIRQQQQAEVQNQRQSPALQRQSDAPLFVNQIITQVKLDVNEQGTEGGAVTLALIDRIGPGYTVQVDGPFLVLIRHDNTKAMLFYGAVLPYEFDPTVHEISLANGVFLHQDYRLSNSYRNHSAYLYNSEVQALDFAGNPTGSTKTINEWVSEKTHGKIPNILASILPPSTSMVLASAMYFKALWEETFIDGATRPREFFPNGKEHPSVMVDMMAHGGCFPYYESPELDARILGLPYKNRLTTMYVIMPNNSNREKLRKLVATLDATKLNQLIARMAMKTTIILFPKMHVSETLDLKSVLQKIGVQTLFDSRHSNLSSMVTETDPEGDQFYNRLQAPTFSPAPELRPTVNMPVYEPNRKTTMGPNNDLKESLIFSRFGNNDSDSNEQTDSTGTEMGEKTTHAMNPTTTQLPEKHRKKRDITYKAPSSRHVQGGPLSSKDFILNKRIVKEKGSVGKKSVRRRSKRSQVSVQNLYVSNAVHQIDLEINETGTEGGAATIVTLNRSGTSVVFRTEAPFLLLIRNDITTLPLFYGAVYDPR